MTFDANWPQEVPHSPQTSGENCNQAPKQRKSGVIVPLKREKPVSDDDISDRARQAIGILKEEFEAVSHDWQRTEALWKAIGLIGRPSGVSPPEPAAPTLELPTSPPAWWRKRPEGMKADKWLRTYYKPYISAGLLTRGFFQRPGQDKAFYNALHQWEQEGNQLPPDLYIPTKAEQNTRQLRQMGVPDPHQLRDGARLYQTARRRLG